MRYIPTIYLTFVLFLTCFQASAKQIVISVESDILEMSNVFLDGQTPADFKDFSGENCQRDIVEFIMVQKALSVGGFKHRFRFVPGNFDARNSRLLLDGSLLLSFDTLWLSFVEQHRDKLYISDPMIRNGEFTAGVYTSLKNQKSIKLRTIEDFRKLTVVSSSDWHVDWQTLSEIKPRQLIDEEDWISMAKLVSKGWVDVMLVSFNNSKPFVYEGPAYKLRAIEGVKVALKDSRHYVVSKQHPMSGDTFSALQTGLKKLRENGEITKAYQECGFLNKTVKNWTLLNP